MTWQRVSCFALLLFAFPLLSEEPKPATLEQIQKALDWSKGEIQGKGPFKAGDKVEIKFELRNTTSDDYIRPVPSNSEKQIIGVNQAWIERIGNDSKIPPYDVAKGPAKRGTKYGAGGAIIPWPEKIKGKEKVMQRNVAIDTKDFPPGKYRITMDYADAKNDKSIKSTTIEFEIAGPPKK